MSESSNPGDGGDDDDGLGGDGNGLTNELGVKIPTSATHLVVPKPRRAGTTTALQTPPPPQPLDLPKPRTPPPRTETPHANRPPEPIPPPAITQNDNDDDYVQRPTRWWTDWLCGCVENGDHQVSFNFQPCWC